MSDITLLSPLFLDNCNTVRSSSPAAVVPDEGLDSAAVAASVFSSGRRVTRSQQVAANTTAKKYPLRQSRSSGSDNEANGKTSITSQQMLRGRRETRNNMEIRWTDGKCLLSLFLRGNCCDEEDCVQSQCGPGYLCQLTSHVCVCVTGNYFSRQQEQSQMIYCLSIRLSCY